MRSCVSTSEDSARIIHKNFFVVLLYSFVYVWRGGIRLKSSQFVEQAEAIYRQISNQDMKAVIPYVKRNEPELLGFDEQFRPTCVREHSYCYDSFDENYKRLKFTRPKECTMCRLREDSLCQKVYKIKCKTDIRKYTYPARGSALWNKLYKEHTAVERLNAYLKEYFQLNNVCHRTGRKAKLHFHLVTSIYNACKLAVNQLNVQLHAQHTVA